MLIRTEQTPNPATRKFLPGQAVMEGGTRDFPDAASAEASPLASALFASGHLVGFGAPLTDMAAGRETGQFKRLAARGGDFRHFFASHRGRGQNQPR